MNTFYKLAVTLFLAFIVMSSLFAQPPNWDSVYADYFKKYAPLDTPAWLFPICFKEYGGDWDTVYIGHDTKAGGNNADIVDTSKFNSYLFCAYGGDSCYKSLIWDFNLYLPDWNSFYIQFTKGRMPLTMYWNDSLFYSDSLPFPDLGDTLPRARGELWCGDFDPNYYNCPTGWPIILTDNPDSICPPLGTSFWRSDSMFFDGDTADYMGTALMLYVVPYKGGCTGYDETTDPDNYFSFYPNPVSGKLYIENKYARHYNYSVYDYLGRRIISDEETGQITQVDFSTLPNGIYFIRIESDDNTLFAVKKIIKTYY